MLPALLAGVCMVSGQNLSDFEKRVTEFTLANGMQFIVLERHEAPVASFHAHVDTGAVNDPGGKTGLAHMFEHMIGKGTESVGTKNWSLERKALSEIEQIYDRLEAERRRGERADKAKVDALEKQLQAAIQKAAALVEPNRYVQLIEENGGTGFNAGTSSDYTIYHYSLPANRSELWFLLQSEWFRQPVYREFYKERDVVLEERRMRVESSPQGKLQEMLLATAFTAHPYRTLVGWASDISNLRATDADEFFKSHYAPSNITVAIAGDVKPAEMRKLAEKYFGPIAARPPAEQVTTVEPAQEGEKRVTVESPSQPFLFIAFKRPDQHHADDPVFDVLSGLLSSGRTGILYKDLVRDSRVSLAAGAVATLPSGKYPNLFTLYSVPAVGHTVAENEKAIEESLEKLKKEPVDAAALQRVKTKLRASVIRQLDSNPGLAEQLAFYHVNYGSWKKLFMGIEEIDKVTVSDVQRVAKTYLISKTRTVAHTVNPAAQEKAQ